MISKDILSAISKLDQLQKQKINRLKKSIGKFDKI